MMKFMHFLHRKEGMTREEFLDYWQHHHATLGGGNGDEYRKAIKMRRYVQVHPGYPRVIEAINAPRGVGKALDFEFDGVAEAWWDSEEDFFASMQTEEGKEAWAAIAADEPNFSDYSRGYVFIGNEIPILDGRSR